MITHDQKLKTLLNKIDGKVEESLLGVEEFIVSLAKEQIRNINANAGHSADDGHNH